jgi:hypothetical protein
MSEIMVQRNPDGQPFFVYRRVIAQYTVVPAETDIEALPYDGWTTLPNGMQGKDLGGALEIDQPFIRVTYHPDWQQGSCSCEFQGKPRYAYLPAQLVEVVSIDTAFTLLIHLRPSCIVEIDQENHYKYQGDLLVDSQSEPTNIPE